MTELRLIFFTYGQFYLRHKGLLLLFVLGFSLGSALISAIYGLNLEASQRYNESSALLANPVTHFIKPQLGEKQLSHTVWQNLSRLSNLKMEPVLEGRVQLEDKRWLSIRGVDLLKWVQFQGGVDNESEGRKNQQGRLFETVFLDPKVITRLEPGAPQKTLTIDGIQYRISPMAGLGYQALMDISLADKLLNANGALSFIEVIGMDEARAQFLALEIAQTARLESASDQSFDTLSGPFFFNLQALAFLGYIVGAFLSFNAIKLAFAARKKLQRQLYILGCQQRRLTQAVVIELLCLGFISAYFGALLGVSLANLLVTDVGRVLRSFYQLDRSLIVGLDYSMVLLGFALNTLVLICFLGSQKAITDSYKRMAAIGVFVLSVIGALVLWQYADSKFSALMLCACVLMVFFVITPRVLKRTFSCQWPTQSPLLLWVKADSQTQINELLSAVLATLMAMGAAIGMQVMVHSFSTALDSHLQKRLSADLYIRPLVVTEQMERELKESGLFDKVGVYWQAPAQINTKTKSLGVKLISFGNSALYHSHITLLNRELIGSQHIAGATDTQLARCLVNEPGWRINGINIGDTVELSQGERQIKCQISGIYYDYGEQSTAILVTTSTIINAQFAYEAFGFSLTLKPEQDIDEVTKQLKDIYGLESSQVSVNKTFKAFAKQLFENTFKVTHALNLFIMLIALFGIWVSFLTLGRQQLQPMAILQTLGVTRKQLFWSKLLQACLILGVTTLLAIPLGILLGWVLLTYVMPIAFGWSMALVLSWPNILGFCAVVLLLALIASAAPLIKLIRRNVADSVSSL
ncbi:ABC transporter permease [Pseudoalteromonas luteoviolacea]|uniref:ABC transporter permease n=1 Tax=Pseudoalteromonas luteoviolacea TaxID=43657 RepID=UPI00114FD337|nr:FtsX-like permease family protein [Pseudoalteromonas luteoviolacea]TQF71248.1 ABC transporter permease [Pseudoalteromonas luteoviolacea]